MKENEREHAVLADSSRYLSACSSLRAISVARLQNQRYSEAYEMLQKTVKSYKKVGSIKYDVTPDDFKRQFWTQHCRTKNRNA